MDIKVYQLKNWQRFVPKFFYKLFRVECHLYKDCYVSGFNFNGETDNGLAEFPFSFTVEEV